jgi:predicted outer membrane repeat protein
MRPVAQLVSGITLLLALCAWSPSADAAVVVWVGDGTPGSCTEAALRDAVAYAALNGGRTIKFNCGVSPVTITLTLALDLPDATTIDGDGAITLSTLPGSISGVVLSVGPASTHVLKALTFDRVGSVAAFALLNEGTLTIWNSTFSNNFVTIQNEGDLTIVHTTFADNGSFVSPGAIWNFGTLTVKGVLFSRNRSGAGGGIVNEGTLTVEASEFARNEGDGGLGSGGGIVNTGTASIKTTLFSRNDAAAGGAIASSGTLAVTATAFDSNMAGPTWGGAIASTGTLTISNSVFSNNSVLGWAGGSIFTAGQAAVSNSAIGGGSAGVYGGGIFNTGVLSVARSVVTLNSAGTDGGGIYTCVTGTFFFFPCAGSLDLTNSVVVGNTPNNVVP